MNQGETRREREARSFVAGLPKAELHLHLEGAVPWRLIRAWSDEGLPERPEWWDPDYRFESFADFLAVMRGAWRPYLNSPERVHEAACGLLRDLAAQKVRYVELSFGLGAYDFPVADVAEAIKSASQGEMTVRAIAGISRDRDLEWMLTLAQEALDAEAVDGLDLHGDERKGRLEDFVPVYTEARERGLITKAHAGELGTAQQVARTVEVLGVERVEHGISAAGDGDVLRFLQERDVTLDVCPLSNVKLKVTPSLRDHPLKALLDAGVSATVSTDDPTVFGQTLTDELGWAVTEMGLSAEDIVKILARGFEVAKMPEDERRRYVEELEGGIPPRHSHPSE